MKQYMRFVKNASCGYIPIDLSNDTISLSLNPGIVLTVSIAVLRASYTIPGEMTQMFRSWIPE